VYIYIVIINNIKVNGFSPYCSIKIKNYLRHKTVKLCTALEYKNVIVAIYKHENLS